MLRCQGRRILQSLSQQCAQPSPKAALSSGPSTSQTASTAASSPTPLPPVLPRPRTAEQLTPEELSASLPSMLFTTRNLVLSTLLASVVAGVGLFSMFWVGTVITDAAAALKRTPEPAAMPPPPPPPPPPKSVAQLIAERKAELEGELAQLQHLPHSKEVKQRVKELKDELRQVTPRPWYSWS